MNTNSFNSPLQDLVQIDVSFSYAMWSNMDRVHHLYSCENNKLNLSVFIISVYKSWIRANHPNSKTLFFFFYRTLSLIFATSNIPFQQKIVHRCTSSALTNNITFQYMLEYSSRLNCHYNIFVRSNKIK